MGGMNMGGSGNGQQLPPAVRLRAAIHERDRNRDRGRGRAGTVTIDAPVTPPGTP